MEGTVLKARSAGKRMMVIAGSAVIAFGLILAASIELAQRLGGSATDPDIASWVQAVGAIMAIVVGFATILCQRALQDADADAARAANARASHLVVTHAMTTVGERLEAILAPEESKHPYRLRGERTTDMIASLRNFDTGRIPHEMLENFLQLRANLHAINERISAVYDSEEVPQPKPRTRSERPSRLRGALSIWEDSRRLLGDVRSKLIAAGQSELASAPKVFDFEGSASVATAKPK
jgi:hypothetical protein